MKQFVLKDPKNDEDCLGGPVGENNVYIASYGAPVNKDDKHPKDLAVGESVLRRYSLSGQSGVYKVVRLEDAPRRVQVLCGCGWGNLAMLESEVPTNCPMCGQGLGEA